MKPPAGSTPRRVGELLESAVPGLGERLREHAIRADWAAIAGPELARRSSPAELKAGVLEIRADNSTWLQELSVRSTELLAALRRRHGDLVRSLRLTLGAVPPPPAPAARGTSRRPRARLDPAETREIDALAGQVADPEVAAALRRLLTRDRLARREPGATEGESR